LKNNNNLTPIQCYEADLKRDGFVEDPAQRQAVEHIQRLFDDLIKPAKITAKEPGFFSKIFRKQDQNQENSFRGLYFWGGVGRGKTYIVDTFFNCLPFPDKTRIHFHSFMHGIHQELKTLKNTQNPLTVVADRYASQSRVICFDEFHVSDITDAMLLGNLFKELFDRNVTLVATSNEHPDELYSGGLQRNRFLPAIELIKKYTEVVNVDSGVDYRFRVLEKAEIYHAPLDEAAEKSLSASFNSLAPEEKIVGKDIEIEGREINTIRHAVGIVWFDFNAICDGPRGAADYIEIARVYHTVLISNVPAMDSGRDDHTKRFMTLIDEFYDRNVKVIISAESEPENLYSGSRLLKSFNRTISRLQEMGTKEYLSRQHISE
jgi:cell division protein ZapE